MNVMQDKDYCEISIEIFLNMTGQVPFDVFIHVGDKFTMISRKNDIADKERYMSYIKKGATHLYILKKDRREYIGATERFIKRIVKEGVSPQGASRAVEELSEQTLFEIFEDRLFDETALRRAQDITKTYVQMMKTDPKVLTQFIQLCREETYLVRHSIATAVFAILIARANGDSNEKMLQIIGLGGLLHDVGMSLLPPEISDVDRKLTQAEWEMVKQHPSLGSKLAEEVKNFPEETKLIIEQHHESYDGSGYPRGLKGDEIYYPAKVVSIADCFSALTTRRGGRSLFTPTEALALLQTEKRKYDPKLLSSFENLLNPGKKKAA